MGDYCDECGVSLDLHDGDVSCETAAMKARVLDKFWSVVMPR